MWRARALYTFFLENFWVKVDLEVLFKIPIFEKILLVFVKSLSVSLEISQPVYLKFFTCNHLLSQAILLSN